MTWTLCETFQWLGKATWNEIKDAGASGLIFGEETITERNLLHLVRYYGDRIRVAAFDKRREGLNGADWEWWIGRPGAWDGMRVQAKRINYPKSDTFLNLHSKWGARNTKKRQIDLLIEASKSESLTPAYCFYVYTDRCLYPPLEHGCLIGHAAAIKKVGKGTLTKLRPVMTPWHFLVCDGADSGTAPGETRVQRALKSSLRGGGWLTEEEAAPLVSATRETLPDYVELLMVPKEQLDEARLDHLKKSSQALERNIKGIVLIDTGGEG